MTIICCRNKTYGRRKGFTLLELVLAIAITAVVGIFLAGFLAPQLKIYREENILADARTECSAVFNYIQDRIHDGVSFEPADTQDATELSFDRITENEPESEVLNGSADGNDPVGKTVFPDLKERVITATFDTTKVETDQTILVTITVRKAVKDETTGEYTEDTSGPVICTLKDMSISCPNTGFPDSGE